MLNGLFTNCDMTGFQLFGINCDGCHMCGRKLLTLSGIPEFTPFDEFMILPIHYIYTILLNLSVLGLCLWINDCLPGLVGLLCIKFILLTQ